MAGLHVEAVVAGGGFGRAGRLDRREGGGEEGRDGLEAGQEKVEHRRVTPAGGMPVAVRNADFPARTRPRTGKRSIGNGCGTTLGTTTRRQKDPMPALPVPMFLAVVFGFLALRILVVKDRPRAFALLLGAIALQAVILSYPVFLPLQPVTATIIPPFSWIVFQVTAVRPLDPGRDLWHAVVPAFTLFVLFEAPALLDALIPTVFVLYAAAILWRLKAGTDGMPRLTLASGEQPRVIWSLIAGALIFSALGDVAISLAMWTGEAWLRPWIVVILTMGNLTGISLLTLSGALAGPAAPAVEDDEAPDASEPTSAVQAAADAALIARLDGLMVAARLYLDPDLTLARIGRRLGLPAKQVSAAVNRATGENVSRLINGYRVRHACERLAAGDSVTQAMLASGFNTKSNFNREFLRVVGMAPSVWVERTTADGAPPWPRLEGNESSGRAPGVPKTAVH